MELKPGIEITAKTIFLKTVTGNVTAILGNSVVIENADGRHVIKNETLKQMGYKIRPSDRTDQTFVSPHRKKSGK